VSFWKYFFCFFTELSTNNAVIKKEYLRRTWITPWRETGI